MMPGFIHWWREAHQHGDADRCRRQRQHHDSEQHFGPGGDDAGGGFGVRRPLRFMAWKLELDEAQIEQLAAILDTLKTERAQAAVDHRRSVGQIADALGTDAFDAAAAGLALESRVESAKRLKVAALTALERTHGMLKPDQRKALAYLLRSGQLTI